MKYEVLVNNKAVLKEDISFWNLQKYGQPDEFKKGDTIQIQVDCFKGYQSQSLRKAYLKYTYSLIMKK